MADEVNLDPAAVAAQAARITRRSLGVETRSRMNNQTQAGEGVAAMPSTSRAAELEAAGRTTRQNSALQQQQQQQQQQHHQNQPQEQSVAGPSAVSTAPAKKLEELQPAKKPLLPAYPSGQPNFRSPGIPFLSVSF